LIEIKVRACTTATDPGFRIAVPHGWRRPVRMPSRAHRFMDERNGIYPFASYGFPVTRSAKRPCQPERKAKILDCA
jgi:hypothetical protein